MDYPFTKDELQTQLCEMWHEKEKLISFSHIAELYKRNNWYWDEEGEPPYLPEFRDVKRLIKRAYFDLMGDFVDMYFKDNKELSCDDSVSKTISPSRIFPKLILSFSWRKKEFGDKVKGYKVFFSVELTTKVISMTNDWLIEHEF